MLKMTNSFVVLLFLCDEVGQLVGSHNEVIYNETSLKLRLVLITVVISFDLNLIMIGV